MPNQREILIGPDPTWKDYLRDLGRSAGLCLIFAWRDMRVRYRHLAFGIGWALFRPLAALLAFQLAFRTVAPSPPEHLPYSLMALAGVLLWQLVSGTVASATDVLVYNYAIITRVYFPRMVLLGGSLLVNFLDFCCGMIILVAGMCYFQLSTPPELLLLPLILLHCAFLSAGLALWCSALYSRYRDLKALITFGLQMGLLYSPVAYSSERIPEQWLPLYALNPLVGLIESFRWCLFGHSFPALGMLDGLSWMVSLAIFFSGAVYFRRTERLLVDIL